MTIKLQYKNELISIIHKHLPKAAIYLFGSRARGDYTSTSDIDLAVDAGEPINYSLLLKILMEIDETAIPMKIDLVDFCSASNILKENIIKEGVKWTN